MKWLDLWQDLSWVRLGQRPQPASVRSPLALSLEPRMLFDGAVAATAIEVADSASAASAPASDGASQQDAQDTPAVDSGAADTRREVVFVDGNIQNYQQLLAGLPTGAEVVVLDASRNGLEQMAEYLEGRTGIDAIHLLSHGESGAFKAGNAWIDAADLASHSETLARIGDALSVDGDFLLYGCSTGEGAAGSALVTELARLTQADVAASTDNTGAQRLGGNWILEAQAGVIEAASLAATEFDALLAAPTTLDFDSVTVDGGGYSLGGSPRVFDGWTVSLVDSGGNNAPDSGGTPSYLDVTRNSIDTILANDGSDKALKVEGYFGVVKEARFTATSGEEFWLQSFHLENVNMGTAVRVIGYRDGVEVASQDFTASVGADTTVTLNHGGDQDWQNIDQFRIVQQNGSSDLFFYIDDIAVSAAVLPNVAPTATNLTQSKAATEAGGAVALDDIVVTDADAGDTITATLTLSNPAAGSLSTGTFGSATSTYNAGTGVWTVTGSVADVNAALAAVALTPSANNDQNFTIATRIRDAANAGPADGTISVTVTGVNDAPTATNLTQSKSATEGGGAVALDDIVVTDVDTGDTITATLTLSDPAAGSLSTGTFGSATSTYNAGTGVWTVTGSVADVNAALAAVALTPSANNDQNFTIATRIRDAADTGPADGTISVTVTGVNDAPSATNLTQSKAATEGGGAVALDDIVVTDVDTGDTLTATLTLSDPAAGSLSSGTFGSATSTYNAGTGMWTVTGSVADVNAALAAVALTPSANNDQNFTIATRIRDAADTGPADGTISVTITGVSDAPTATNLTQSKSATEGGGAVALDDIVVTDVDTGDTITATLTLSDPAAGSLSTGTFGSATSTYNAGTGVWTVTGSVADVNAALAAVALTPSANNDQNFTIATRIRDAADTGPADGTITVTVTPVNDAPVVTTSGGSNAFTEDGSATVIDGGLTLSDVDDTAFASATVAITGNFASGQDVLAFTNDGSTMGNISASYNAATGVLSLTSAGGTATLAQWQAALRSVTYSNSSDAPSTANRSISFTVNDGDTDSNTATKQVSVAAVNDAPVASVPANISVTEDTASALTGISFSDADAGGSSVTVTLSVPSGSLSATSGGGVTVGGTSSALTLTGSIADINTFIVGSNLTFTTAANSTASVTLTVGIDDGGNTGSGGAQTDSETVELQVAAVNDAPAISAPISINVDEDISTALTGVSFADVDAGSGSVTATFSVGSGSLSATSGSGVTVAGSDTGSLTLTGTIADINAFISANLLSFQTAANSTGNVVLTVDINDGGNTGSGGAQSDSTTVTLLVTAVNDAPLNNLPAAQSVDQDSVLVFSSGNGNLISIADVDAGGGNVRVTLTATNGVISLGGTTGLSFITGTGTADATMTVEGTLADINLAMNGMSFSPTGGYNGPASLQITTDDLGLSGSGGNQIDTDTLAITVNSLNPEVTSVNVTNPDGGYKVGDVITVTVTFDQAVSVNTAGGTPTLLLETGSSDRQATYVSGSGSNTLTFSYTVQAGDLSADLDYQSTGALALNGATVRNATNDDAILTLPTTGGANSIAGQHDVVIDGVAPTVGSVSVPANATYIAGQNLDFTVNFDEAITVDTAGGTPRIAITLDTGGTVYASYLSGSGSSALVFRYTVQSGNLDSNGISVGSGLDANGGALQDAVGNAASVTLNGVGSTAGVLVDAVVPTVASVSVPANGSYNEGDVLSFTVNASEAVLVDTAGGTPRLALDIGGVTRYASYASGSGSSALVFQYSVQAGDTDGNGIDVSGALDLNGGTTRDAAGNDLNLTLNSVGATGGVLVDTTAPLATGIVRVDATPTGANSVSYTVTFGEGVSGVDASDFSLVFGGTAAGSITSVTQVDAQTYTVEVGNLSGVGSLRLDLNAGGTGIADMAGNALTGGLAGASYSIDRSPPSVSSVGVPADGTYVAGQALDFTVDFDETVVVDTSGGTPRIAITLDNGAAAFAEYVSGSGSTQLTFRYVVQSGQLDQTGITLGSNIQTNGGTLRDAVGNDALAGLNNVAATDGVQVDALQPTASISLDSPSPSDPTSLSFVVTFDEDVSGVDLGDFSLLLGGAASGVLQSLTQIDARTYLISVSDARGPGTLGLTLNAGGSAIVDAHGNALAQSTSLVGYQLDAPTNGDPEFRATPPAPPPLPPATPLQPNVPGSQPPSPTSPLLPPPLFEQPTLGSGIPTLGNIFINNGALAPSFIAQVFASSDGFGDGAGKGFLGFGGGDAGVFGSSSLSMMFNQDVPQDGPQLEVFDGKQWRGGDVKDGLRGVFGAPSLGQQLQEINDQQRSRISDLARALGQFGQEPEQQA